MLARLVELSLRYKVLVLVAFAVIGVLGVSGATAKCRSTPFPTSRRRRSTSTPSRRVVAAEDIERLLTVPIEAAHGRPAERRGRALVSPVRPVLRRRVLQRRRRHLLRAPAGRRNAAGGQGPPARKATASRSSDPTARASARCSGTPIGARRQEAEGSPSAMDLRTLHDWTVRLILRTAPGVDDVTTWGGHEKQYQVQIDPPATGQVRPLLQGGDGAAGGQQHAGRRAVLVNIGRRAVPGARPGPGQQRRGHRRDRARGARRRADLRAGRGPGQGGAGGALRRGDARRQGRRCWASRWRASTRTRRPWSEAVKASSPPRKRRFPKGVELKPVYDRTEIVDKALATAASALIEGSILVAIVLFLFLGELRARWSWSSSRCRWRCCSPSS